MKISKKTNHKELARKLHIRLQLALLKVSLRLENFSVNDLMTRELEQLPIKYCESTNIPKAIDFDSDKLVSLDVLLATRLINT
ncbi:hypothetical protein HDV06_003663 [Boothiomyces sp. JEL0866]|nr:hypothetical protein HDV06_003663 [Boothiomyces sp. JEL0866]